LSDGDGNNTNPNESAISLPASFNVVTGQALHYDPAGGSCLAGTAGCTAANAIGSTGATSNTTLLQRYTNGNLVGCGTGPCNWTQGISYYGDDQDTHYNALQAKLTKTMTHGLSINANYAYQVGTDAASNFATWNKQAVIGNDQAIRRSAFTGYGLWRLPFGHNGMVLTNVNTFTNYLVSGWEFSPVFAWQSGLPYSLSFSECGSFIPGNAPCQPNGSTQSLHTGIQGYPSVTGSSKVTFFTPPSSNICAAGNTSSFTCTTLGQIGSIKRNSVFGPSFFNADMSISKNLTFHDRYVAQFRMDAFNTFNHINLGNPNGNVENGGLITGGPYPTSTGGTTNPRQLQFTLHFAF
jgi:hypothetical protein